MEGHIGGADEGYFNEGKSQEMLFIQMQKHRCITFIGIPVTGQHPDSDYADYNY